MAQSVTRQQVIAQLVRERQTFSTAHGRYVTYCELRGMPRDPQRDGPEDTIHWCNHLAGDAHEAIIKRSAVQGNDDLITAVTETPYNLALLCHECHMRWGQTSQARYYLTGKLITRYGADMIIGWIDSLVWKGAAEHKRFVRSVAEALSA